jgi:hypothetical protein
MRRDGFSGDTKRQYHSVGSWHRTASTSYLIRSGWFTQYRAAQSAEKRSVQQVGSDSMPQIRPQAMRVGWLFRMLYSETS